MRFGMRKLSRNEQCWCGSGKKYKKCHLDSDIASGALPENRGQPSPGVIIKIEEQIKGIRKSCQLTKKILDIVAERIGAGINTNKINEWVHDYTVSHGAKPAPLHYNGYPKSVCVSLNNVVCHGIPDNTVLKDGDILNVDVTTVLDGYYGDAGRRFMIGKPSEEGQRLVEIARECLYIGIEQVKPNHDLGEIGYAIEQHAMRE